jgi:hypothetical protein
MPNPFMSPSSPDKINRYGITFPIDCYGVSGYCLSQGSSTHQHTAQGFETMAVSLIAKSVFLVSLVFPGNGNVVYKYETEAYSTVFECVEAARTKMERFEYLDKNDAGCTFQVPLHAGYQFTAPIGAYRAAKSFWVTED